MGRQIIHLNITNFFVAVARTVQPQLLSYPVAIATPGSMRRILLDLSYQATCAGLVKGMLLETAKRRCPDLVVLDPRPELYERAHQAILNELSRLSPRVEQAGPGHFFIDLTGTARLWGMSLDLADHLCKITLNKFRLPSAVGLSPNKVVSKIATRVMKPSGVCEVMPGQEADFMAPLPIRYLPGLDPKLILLLQQFNLSSIGEIASFSPEALGQVLGQKALEICHLARGEDHTPVRELTEPEPSLEEIFIFEGQTNDQEAIEKALFQMVCRSGFQLRNRRLAVRLLELSLIYADGVISRKSLKIDPPLCGDLSLYEAFLDLLRATYTRRIRLSKMTLRLLRLSFPYGQQLDLFGQVARERKLMKALDNIRTRFGQEAITFYGRQQQVGRAS